MGQGRAALRIVLNTIIGYAIFLVLIGLVNYLAPYFNSQLFTLIVQFLDNNFWLITLFTFLLMIGGIFSVLYFPLNLPYPIVDAIASVFILRFIFNVIIFIGSLFGVIFGNILEISFYIAAIIVFLITILVGYISIADIGDRRRKRYRDDMYHEGKARNVREERVIKYDGGRKRVVKRKIIEEDEE